MAQNDSSLGWVVEKVGEPAVLRDFKLRPLDGSLDVEVEIIASGLCHTDCHMAKNDWGCSEFPLVCGHEGVGKVTKIGAQVRNVKVGQFVGIGWICDSCGSCRNCAKGEENICWQGYSGTILGKNTGTFAKYCRIKEKFCFPIPETLDPVRAAPLLCAGMTVYQPMRRYITYPGQHVGVVGIGGLGHLAIKFAHHMGAHVTVFSTSPDKRTEAMAMGAHDFVVCKDDAQMEKAKNTQDFIIDTAPAPVNWNQYMDCLRAGGVFCLVGVPTDTIPINTVGLVFNQKSVVGSIVAGSFVMREMLDFCAQKQIYPDNEYYDFKDLPAAMERCLSGKARYRIVLKW